MRKRSVSGEFFLNAIFDFRLVSVCGESAAATGIEDVVERAAADGGEADGRVDAGEAERLLESAEHVGADAEAEIERDEVGRDGDAYAHLLDEFDADGLAVRHEGAIAETDEDAGEQHHPARGGDGEQEQAAREAGVGRIHDEVFPFAVEEDAGDGARDGDGERVDDEE